jgi:zinc protease
VFRRSAGPFLVSSGVRTEVTAPAVVEILKEVKRIRDSELSPEELSLAKNSIVRSLPADFETSGRVSGSTASLFVYDLGLDYYTKLPLRYEAVTAAAVLSAAQKYLVPDRMIVVAVGDRARIGAELRKLNLGAMEIRTADGTVATH